MENLFNISEDKIARASSFSKWSHNMDLVTDPTMALSDNGLTYAFHTEKEDSPFVIIDLFERFELALIYIKNRNDMFKDRARLLQIELSDDEKSWIKVPNKLLQWNQSLLWESKNYSELKVNLANNFKARFVKISLAERNYLHLKEIRIFSNKKPKKFIKSQNYLYAENECKNYENLVQFFPTNNAILSINNKNINELSFNNFKCNFNLESNKDCEIDLKFLPKTNENFRDFTLITDFYSIKINNEEKLVKLTSSSVKKPILLKINIKKDEKKHFSIKARTHNYTLDEGKKFKSIFSLNDLEYRKLHQEITHPKRMAICLYGHLRTYEKTYESFLQHIVLPNKNDSYLIDIFIHTWDTLSSDVKSWHQGMGLLKELDNVKVDESILKKVNEIYKPIKVIVEHLPEGVYGQWISREKLTSMVSEYALENNFTYDCVLFTRPDLMFKSDLNVDIYFNHYKNGNMYDIQIDDAWFFTSSNIFKRMPVADPRYVNEWDLLFFHSAHVLLDISPTKTIIDYKNSMTFHIPINYEVNKHFSIQRSLK